MHNLESSWTKPVKNNKFSPEPMTCATSVQCSTNWAIKPTGSWPLCEFLIKIQTRTFFKLILQLLDELCIIFFLRNSNIRPFIYSFICKVHCIPTILLRCCVSFRYFVLSWILNVKRLPNLEGTAFLFRTFTLCERVIWWLTSRWKNNVFPAVSYLSTPRQSVLN